MDVPSCCLCARVSVRLDGRGCKKEVRCEMVPNVPLRSFPTDFRPIVAIPGSCCTQTQTHITTPEAVDVH